MKMKLSGEALKLLDDIESRIDAETEDDFLRQWEEFIYGGFTGDIFTPVRKKKSVPSEQIQHININDAITDYEKMLISQLEGVSKALASDTPTLSVRANYGTGIMTSLFGAEIFVMPYTTDTLPTTRALDGTDAIRALPGKGVPDLTGGLGGRVFEAGEYFAEVFSGYPKIQKYVSVYHPDLQGPLDVCELLWGGDMFYAMYDEPELVQSVLRLITDTYIAFMDKWNRLFPPRAGFNVHWNIMHRGGVMLRDDSAMNLSPQLYKEFAYPRDAELLAKYDGGAVHFCGRGDHYIDILCDAPGLYAINMSQPHLNDMEKIYRNTVDKGVKIVGFPHQTAEKDKTRAGGFGGCLNCQ